MSRTEMCRFGIANWIFLLSALNLFTYSQGGDDTEVVRFEREPSDAVAGVGERVMLACSATAALSWRFSAKDEPNADNVITEHDRDRKQLSNGSLLIESMSAPLAGNYQCVATSRVGTILSKVAVLFLAEIPEFASTARSVGGVRGGAVVLPCALRTPPRLQPRVVTATAAHADTKRPAHAAAAAAANQPAQPPVLVLNITWYHNGSLVSGADFGRVWLSASGALELEPARFHDAGSYVCRVALHAAPHLYRTSEEIELRISPDTPNVESPPRFITTPQTVTVMEGASVTFECAAVGNPKPDITWLHNGVAIDFSDLDSRFHVSVCGSLRVLSARAADAGAYTCRAHTRRHHADHVAQLHVLSGARVWVRGGGGVVRAHARGPAALRCGARGRPPPAVRWYKDGERITPNHHDVDVDSDGSLRIQGVLPVDGGMLQCRATNIAGDAQQALRLLVLPPLADSMANTTIGTTSTPPITKKSRKIKNKLKSSGAQDIFNSLVSMDDLDMDRFDDEDFLGETSSAFTSDSHKYAYDDIYDNNLDSDSNLHADHEELDFEKLPQNETVVSAPKDFKAVIVKHRFVTLTWDEPDTKLEDIVGYLVVYNVVGSNRSVASRSAGVRREMIVPLQPNSTYEVTARALTASAVSPPTQVVSVSTPGEEVTFGPPTRVRAETAPANRLRVLWAPPKDAQPDRYAIYYTSVETGREQVQWVSVDPALAEHSAVVSAGVRGGAVYAVRVAGEGGAASAALRVVTAAHEMGGRDAPPDNVTAHAAGDESIVVRWQPPPQSARGSITGYRVRYRVAGPAAGRRKPDAITTPPDVTEAKLTGLDPDTTYQIRVCAMSANGSGPFSAWIHAVTSSAPRRDDAVPAAPPPLTTRAGRDWISVWWGAGGGGGSAGGGGDSAGGGGGVRGWWLGWGLGVPDDRTAELPHHQHSHVIRGLQANSEYVISLRASNLRGLGPAVYATVRTRDSHADDDDLDVEDDLDDIDDLDDLDDDDDEDEDDQPPLLPPVGVKVIMLSGTTAVVYWTDPTLPKGQAATDGRVYVVRWAATGAQRAKSFNATDLNCMVDDLRPYTTYDFAVKLIKGGRESAWSLLVSNRTLEAAPATAPRDTRASPAQPPHRAADIAWQPPVRPNGLITGYVIMYAVQRSDGTGGEWSAVTVTGDRTRARVDRLRSRTAYLFKVQARNSKGLGPFGPVVVYTTAMESAHGGGGLGGATSAWLWASAGGALAVLALAAALALSLCCRRHSQPMSPDTSTYQKSSASAAIKPPDLWIHHDQMELKHMDKSLHSSAVSSSSVDGVAGGALAASTLTLRGAGGGGAGGAGGDYDTAAARHAPAMDHDRRHMVPTYVESTGSCCSDGTYGAASRGCVVCEYTPMTGVGVGSLSNMGTMPNLGGMSGMSSMGGMGTLPGCASTCDRRHHPRHMMMDQSLALGGGGGLRSPQSSLASLSQHPHTACASSGCPLTSGAGVGAGLVTSSCCAGSVGAAGAPTPVGGASDIYAIAAREQGHYVAYEPLGHYTHRESVSSSAGSAGGAGGAGGSLPRAGAGAGAGLHSFSDTSERSTPARARESTPSPYKQHSASATSRSPGHVANRLLQGGSVPHSGEELEPLTPSRSTERLHREMQNLEGLMKDLSAITQHQFHC